MLTDITVQLVTVHGQHPARPVPPPAGIASELDSPSSVGSCETEWSELLQDVTPMVVVSDDEPVDAPVDESADHMS